jgi:hypothetical protein
LLLLPETRGLKLMWFRSWQTNKRMSSWKCGEETFIRHIPPLWWTLSRPHLQIRIDFQERSKAEPPD